MQLPTAFMRGVTMGSADIIHEYRPHLEPYEELYRHVHQNAELSCKEARTASLVGEKLKALGYTVHARIGGYGVVGVLENNQGPTVLLRSELYALPIEEKIGLPYASHERGIDQYGYESPVMHACGHDMHLTCLLGAAQLLVKAKPHWRETLLVLFQPNEEHTGGAHAMINDGLYQKVPIPDVVLGQHSMPGRAGWENLKPGVVLSAADICRVHVFGTLKKTLDPQGVLNPISLACNIVTRIEAVVNNEISPLEFASIQCEEIHAGRKGLDYVEEAELVLDVKSYKAEVRSKLHDAIRRVVRGEYLSARVERKPEVTFTVRAPLTYNDADTVHPLKAAFNAYFKENSRDGLPSKPCEDFSILASTVDNPYAYWWFGTADGKKWDEAERAGKLAECIAQNHSPYYAPAIQPTLQTGLDALALAALTFLC